MQLAEAPYSSDLLALIREVELRRVDARGHVYLDHTGAALYPESLLREHAGLLRRRTLGNPHATSPASHAASDDVAEAKQHVLRYFDADPAEWDVAFTAGASAALKLVGESFPWSPRARLVLSADNHNSVNGIREFARRRGARVTYLPLDDELRLAPVVWQRAEGPALFAVPAQSNFSGVRHPLSLVAEARDYGYTVLLDAAAFAPTASLSLRTVPADFVAISFYKMFGYPTGIGALIARRESLRQLERPWFGGGTVLSASVAANSHQLKDGAEAFEDGTVNFLAACGVSLGLSFLERIGPQRVSRHVSALCAKLLSGLADLRHCNGRPVIVVYGPRGTHGRGGTIAFNVLRPDGRTLSPDDVLVAAGTHEISLRSGCFCNPGAAECALGENATTQRAGALRASLGYGSNAADVNALLHFLEQTYRS